MDDIAKRIKELRGSRTLRDFARTVDFNEATLRSYERGLSNPNFEFIHAVCMKFQVSPDWLVFGRGAVYGPVYTPESGPEPVPDPGPDPGPDVVGAGQPGNAPGIGSPPVYPPSDIHAHSGLREEVSAYAPRCPQCAAYAQEMAREREESRRAMVTAQFLLTENARLTAENGKLRTEKLYLQQALDTAARAG